MKPIPEATIVKVRKKLNELSIHEAPRRLELMNQRQPLILAYLMAVGDDLLNDDERELLLFLGLVVWEIMSQEAELPPVQENLLIAEETGNLRLMGELWRDPERAIDRTIEFLDAYNQSEVLRMVFDAVMEEAADEEGEIRDENRGNLFVYLKTVIDCFDHGI
jgi:hypothetical protein